MRDAKHPIGQQSIAMVTPFHADGSLDTESAVKLARHVVGQGADCILLSGTTGEAPTTYQPEKNDLTDAVVEAVGEDAFVLAGAGSNDTAHAVRMAVNAEEHGAHGLLVVSPYYNRPSQKGLRAHVDAILAETSLPVVLYDIPGRTGLAFSDETLDYFATNPRIVAVKDATGKPEQAIRRMNRTGIAYYSGDDGLNSMLMSQGAAGIISVVGHVAAAFFAKEIEAINEGDCARAASIQRKLTPLIDAIMGTGQGAVLAKAALHMMGIIESGALRLPLVPAEPDELQRLRDALKELELL